MLVKKIQILTMEDKYAKNNVGKEIDLFFPTQKEIINSLKQLELLEK